GLMNIPVRRGLTSLLAGLAQDEPCLLVGMDPTNATMRRFVEPANLDDCRLQEFAGLLVTADPNIATSLASTSLQDRFGTPVACRFEAAAELPHLDSGALDYAEVRALLSARRRGSGRSEPVAPSTLTEEAVARIWQEVLGVGLVSVEDDFFTSGGSSL